MRITWVGVRFDERQGGSTPTRLPSCQRAFYVARLLNRRAAEYQGRPGVVPEIFSGFVVRPVTTACERASERPSSGLRPPSPSGRRNRVLSPSPSGRRDFELSPLPRPGEVDAQRRVREVNGHRPKRALPVGFGAALIRPSATFSQREKEQGAVAFSQREKELRVVTSPGLGRGRRAASGEGGEWPPP